jgi:hypothetical protein
MSTYEKMVNQFVTGVLATNEEMVAHMRIAGWTAPIYNISGLAFGKQEVLERIGGAQNINHLPIEKCVWALPQDLIKRNNQTFTWT